MDTITRRRFLIASGVTAGAALAAGGTVIGLHDLIAAGQRHPLPSDASILVLVTLYGGNDGLNTLIPAGQAAYQDARPQLAYQPHEVLPLAAGLGLNPSMTGFKSLWAAGKLAIVRGVSYPQPDHSHFRSMAIWQTAAPAQAVPTGWLGRWLDATGADPLRAVAIGATLPPLLAGATVAGAALPLTGLALPRQLAQPLVGLAAADAADPPLQARSAGCLADLHRVEQTFAPILDTGVGSAASRSATATSPAPVGTATGGELASQLAVVTRCIAAGAPTRVYSVSLSGFDTHAGEKATQSRLLGQLDTAVSDFLATMRTTAVGRRVVVAIYSEFGRRVAANANQGTDHGTAGPVFIAGEPVTGGFFGDEPSLTALDSGDLKVTTDFRDVYATLLDRVLGADPGGVITDYRARDIGFL